MRTKLRKNEGISFLYLQIASYGQFRIVKSRYLKITARTRFAGTSCLLLIDFVFLKFKRDTDRKRIKLGKFLQFKIMQAFLTGAKRNENEPNVPKSDTKSSSISQDKPAKLLPWVEK